VRGDGSRRDGSQAESLDGAPRRVGRPAVAQPARRRAQPQGDRHRRHRRRQRDRQPARSGAARGPPAALHLSRAAQHPVALVAGRGRFQGPGGSDRSVARSDPHCPTRGTSLRALEESITLADDHDFSYAAQHLRNVGSQLSTWKAVRHSRRPWRMDGRSRPEHTTSLLERTMREINRRVDPPAIAGSSQECARWCTWSSPAASITPPGEDCGRMPGRSRCGPGSVGQRSDPLSAV
jgi:hypothetical protein